MKLTGNTILITGGTSGIGLEFAKQLCGQNTVIITGRDQRKLESAKAELGNVHTLQSDVTNPDAIKALYEQVTKEFPELNILINNAGIMHVINLQQKDLSLTELTQEIDTNINGPVRMTVQFLPHLQKQNAAAIVNVSSALAFVPLPATPVYCATKSAIHSFTQSLRVQLKDTNVNVFELAPPATKTPLLASAPEGVKAMDVTSLVQAAINGIKQDQVEIRPGQSNMLRNLSRLIPSLTLDKLMKAAGDILKNTP